MRTSHIEMKRRIESKKDTFTDEQIFASGNYTGYLTDLAEAASKRYKRKCAVKMLWDEEPGACIGFTDNRKITINAANPITQSFPSRPLRSLSLIGIMAHEVGHLLYSDFSRLRMAKRNLEKGMLYPGKLKLNDKTLSSNLEEMKEFLGDEDKRDGVIACYLEMQNILEDRYIEARMCDAFPGSYQAGIMLNSVRMVELMPSISKMLGEGWPEYSICTQLMLQYLRSGDVNSIGKVTNECVETFYQTLAVIDEAVYDDDPAARFKGALTLCAYFWPYIKEIAEHKKEKKDLTGNSEINDSTGKPVEGPGFYEPDFEKLNKSRSEAQEVIAAESDRIALTKTTSILSAGNGSVTLDNEYLGTGYGNAANDITRLLTDMASREVEEAMEQELTKELEEESEKIRYGNAHEGVPLKIHRIGAVPESLEDNYHAVIPSLLPIAKQLSKKIRKEQKEKGGHVKGLRMGKRLDSATLHRRDGTHFTKKSLPIESLNLSVAVLVDESGSMSSSDRITYGRAASLVIYEFCRMLHIPILIYGHSTDYDDEEDCQVVDLFSYAEFNSVDGKDRFRIMDMAARSSNRDGMALRFVAERLTKRTESQRILILISDGQPAAYGYGGTEAEADLRGIKQEYTRKGIQFFAAAIGSDRENIERIYGSGFLDITNLNQLPIKLTKLIQKHIRM